MSKEKTWFEKLLDLIPGFHGYRRREFIREDDRLIREFMVKTLNDAVSMAEDIEATIVDRNYPLAERLDETLRDLRRLMDEIRWAEHGYAPHYNIYKIKEEDLMRIRDVDSEMVKYVMDLKEYVEEMYREAVNGSLNAQHILNFIRIINSVKDKWLERLKIIRGWVTDTGSIVKDK